MKIKIFLSAVILFSSLYGFKYLRENGMVMPIKSEDLIKLKDQVVEMVSGDGGGLTEPEDADTPEVGLKKDSEEPQKKEAIVGFKGSDKILHKEGEYVEPSEPVSDKEASRDSKEENSDVAKKHPEETYLEENGINIDKSAAPSYGYLKKCGVCHGDYGTGFNDGQELVGGPILHYNTESLYIRLVDFKNGELEGQTMQKILEGIEKEELRKIASEVMGFKK